MEKRRKWQLWLIIAVLVLTVYNILPTIFYYCRPLKQPIDTKKAEKISLDIAHRINSLENESLDWVSSYCDLLKIRPTEVHLAKESPQWIEVSFSKEEEAKKLRTYLPRAGSLIPFVPAQLFLPKQNIENDPKKVLILRQIAVHLDEKNLDQYFAFSEKVRDNKVAPLYQNIVTERIEKLVNTLTYKQNNLDETLSSSSEQRQTFLQQFISHVQSLAKLENKTPLQRYFSQLSMHSGKKVYSSLLSALNSYKDECRKNLATLKDKAQNASHYQSQIHLLEKKEKAISGAIAQIKKYKSYFTPKKINLLQPLEGLQEITTVTEVSLSDLHPFISAIKIDWKNDQLLFTLHDDFLFNDMKELLLAEFARVSKESSEILTPLSDYEYKISLNVLPESHSFLTFKLDRIADLQAKQIKEIISSLWTPALADLQPENFPIYDSETYANLPEEEKELCLVVHVPSYHKNKLLSQANDDSIYLIAKGLDKMIQKYENHRNSPQATQFFEDFSQLQQLLRQAGFIGYPSSGAVKDYLFEKSNIFDTLLAATREQFVQHGLKKHAVLEFTDTEQRIITQNKIDTAIHEDLLKTRDDYASAKVSLDPVRKFDVPKPKKSPFWNNLLLSTKKYFRGDERKILHWGLDLSGGKSVTLELRDQKNQIVTEDDALTQGINELYARVNKMGLSEVTIRKEGNKVALDFPGSQNLSATELVKASTMYFHLINEKFSEYNQTLSPYVHQFLQEVWNEAVVTNQKDIENIKQIALKRLYGDELSVQNPMPKSEAAQVLLDQGLKLSLPSQRPTAIFDDSLSTVAKLRDDVAKSRPHPLLFIFHNYALEGSSLHNVRSSYDPDRGNFLSFEVQKNRLTKDGETILPREDFHNWTSAYCKEKVSATANDYLQGHGWRMAVILNGQVISAPNLTEPLSNNSSISGGFSQREVNLLVSDLKAGSLSFAPKILSEKNISPELGKQDRAQGIWATIVALILVIAAMVAYYRFAGVVASFAVILNLIIMWAILQNLQATLTLAGIAAIILTLGMAVDANVLVFERVKEEFALTKRISSALHAGYKKAFSAIFDSNITTILAALILLNFESGPIKAFAITLIIGIASSMFTALFLTRFFFAGWVQKAKNPTLTMSNLIHSSRFDFLKRSTFAFTLSLVIIGVGTFFIYQNKTSIFGMDFTGGYTLNVELESKEIDSYRAAAEIALTKQGASIQDIEVRELSPSNQLRIRLSTSMENPDKPFFQMPLKIEGKNTQYSYQTDPRLNWVVNALSSAGLKPTEPSLINLDKDWSVMSGQMSQSMRNHAILGLSLALLAIFIYITFRFEFTFAISAILCTLHDVFITFAAVGLLFALGLPLQIDLHTITAIMTIIGYSLNDTIIIFDRIREDAKSMRKRSLADVVNHSLNTTLSRTTITSGTTLLVLVALVTLGGSSIFNFAMVMTIGVVFGTLSSLFIASPLMLRFHKKEMTSLHWQEK